MERDELVKRDRLANLRYQVEEKLPLTHDDVLWLLTRIAALEVGISCQEILDNCDQHKRIEELTGITRQLKADNKRLREALIHTAGICNPVSGFLKNTTGLRKKHVENVQAIALAALGGKHD